MHNQPDQLSERLKSLIVKAMVNLYTPTRLIGGPTFGQYADAIIANLAAAPEAASLILSQQQRIAELEEALREIAAMTNPDDSDSYRSDDREGCLDTIHALASRTALSTEMRV